MAECKKTKKSERKVKSIILKAQQHDTKRTAAAPYLHQGHTRPGGRLLLRTNTEGIDAPEGQQLSAQGNALGEWMW